MTFTMANLARTNIGGTEWQVTADFTLLNDAGATLTTFLGVVSGYDTDHITNDQIAGEVESQFLVKLQVLYDQWKSSLTFVQRVQLTILNYINAGMSW